MCTYSNLVPPVLQPFDETAQHSAQNGVARRVSVLEAVPAVPPCSNTGALTAKSENIAFPDGFASSPTIDWLAFTIHPQEIKPRLYEKPLEPGDDILFLKSALISCFGGGDPLPSGLNGYQSSVSVLGTGRVCWHVERPEMGVHVILPSSALARHSQITGVSVEDFLYDMSTRGAKFTRLDLALDSDVVPVATVIDAHRANLTVTKAQKWQIIENESGGYTLYIGARAGRRMVRIYDKAAEQRAKGNEVAGVWSRCEVEFKQEHAITAVAHLLDGVDPRELILASVDFRNDDNPQVERRSRCDWWQSWVEVTSKVKFPIVKMAAAVADAMAWVFHQVAPTLAYLSMYMGNTSWLGDMARDAVNRVPGWRWDMLPGAL